MVSIDSSSLHICTFLPIFVTHFFTPDPLNFKILVSSILTIYAPVIYTRPCIMLWRRGWIYVHYVEKFEGAGPWNSRVFGPCEMASSR
jgi:hypothetical protein